MCDAGYYSAVWVVTSTVVSRIGVCEVPMLLGTVRLFVFGLKCCDI
jgi:hypothetical protein